MSDKSVSSGVVILEPDCFQTSERLTHNVIAEIALHNSKLKSHRQDFPVKSVDTSNSYLWCKGNSIQCEMINFFSFSWVKLYLLLGLMNTRLNFTL